MPRALEPEPYEKPYQLPEISPEEVQRIREVLRTKVVELEGILKESSKASMEPGEVALEFPSQAGGLREVPFHGEDEEPGKFAAHSVIHYGLVPGVRPQMTVENQPDGCFVATAHGIGHPIRAFGKDQGDAMDRLVEIIGKDQK